jgi:hypothetical protein
LKHADDSDNHKKKLCVKNDAENVGNVVVGVGTTPVVCMPHHKSEDCEKYGSCEEVMFGIVFWDINNTENPY